MSEENKNVVIETKKCFCESLLFKEFITKTLAVFVGVFCALSLFSALHRPKMPPCPCIKMMKRPPIHHMYHHRGPAKFEKYTRMQKADFYKRVEDRRLEPKEIEKAK